MFKPSRSQRRSATDVAVQKPVDARVDIHGVYASEMGGLKFGA